MTFCRERGARVLEERLTAGSKSQAQTPQGDVETGDASNSRPNNGAK